MSESGCVAAGLGFNPTKKKSKEGAGKKDEVMVRWDRVTNVDVIGVEFAGSLFALTNNWNTGVNNWLKNYVYFRVESPKWLPLNPRTFANIVTKTTSALWHGVYSGYYLFFLSAAILNIANDLTHAILRPFFLQSSTKDANGREKEGAGRYPMKYVYDFLGWVAVMSCMNYLGVSFVILRWETSYVAWSQLAWYGHIAPILGAVVTVIIGKMCRRRSRSEKGKGEAKVDVKPSKDD